MPGVALCEIPHRLPGWGWGSQGHCTVFQVSRRLWPNSLAVHLRVSTHTRTHTRTVTGRASPSLPRLQGCLFHRGVLVARLHLELRRVLGVRGDLAGPGEGEPLSPEQRQASPRMPAPPRPVPQERPHSPSDPRRLSRPSLREVPADPENRRSSDTQPVGMAPAPPPTSAASQLSAPKASGMRISATHEDGSEIPSQN